MHVCARERERAREILRNRRSVQFTEIKSRQTHGGLYMRPAKHKFGSLLYSES